MCIDDEISFEIPESWVWVRLEDISFVGTGSTPDRTNKEYYTGSIPWVNSSLTQNDYILQTPEFISEKAIEETSCRIYPIGTLIVAMYGQGKTRGQVSELKIAAATNQACAAIQVYNCDIKTFVKLFFKYNYTTIRRKASGGAQPNLNLLKIKKIVLPLPPLAEQKRIVAKIEELMPILHKYDKAQKVLDELNGAMPVRLRQSILQEAIQGKLIPQDPNDEPASALLDKIRAEKVRLVKEGKLKKKDIIDSIIFKGDDNKYYEQIGKNLIDITDDIPFDIPSNWVWTRIGYLFAHNNGKQLNKGNSAGTLMEYITTSNLYWDGFKLDYLKMMPFEESEIERCQAIKGDLLVCEGGDVGRSCIWTYDYPIMLQNHIHKLRAYLPLCTKYFFYIFYLYNLIGLIGGKGIGIQGFSAKALHNTIIPLPPLKEQERIVKKIETVLDKIKVV